MSWGSDWTSTQLLKTRLSLIQKQKYILRRYSIWLYEIDHGNLTLSFDSQFLRFDDFPIPDLKNPQRYSRRDVVVLQTIVVLHDYSTTRYPKDDFITYSLFLKRSNLFHQKNFFVVNMFILILKYSSRWDKFYKYPTHLRHNTSVKIQHVFR